MGGWSGWVNLDGFASFEIRPPTPSHAYVQMFRHGAAESVCVLESNEDEMLLRSQLYEEQVGEFVRQYLELATKLEVEPPFYAFLSFLGVQGCRFAVQGGTEVVPVVRTVRGAE